MTEEPKTPEMEYAHLKVDHWYTFKNYKQKLQFRRVAEKGFNFCDKYQQKKFRDNIYTPALSHDSKFPEELSGKSYIFAIPRSRSRKITGLRLIHIKNYLKYKEKYNG